MSETFARDLVGVLCYRPRELSSFNFTMDNVLDMTLDDAIHYYDQITSRWRREVSAINTANRKR